MDVRYDSTNGDLTIVFAPVEARELALLMELVFEDEGGKGTHVPDLQKDFFREFATSKEKIRIDFEFEYLEFCIAFLVEVYEEMVDHGADATELRQFLGKVSRVCSAGHVMH